MSRSHPRAIAVLGFLIVSTACSGPTRPTTTAGPQGGAPSAPASADHGTIALVSTTPAAGGDLAVDAAHSGQTQFSATFSVTVDAALTNATLALQLIDASGTVCGSATSDPQNLAAGQSATFTVAVTTISCAATATVEQLHVTLGSGVAPGRADYLAGTFAAHYGLRPGSSAVTVSGVVLERGGGPLAGAEILVEDGADAGRTTRTDAAGHYALTGLAAGSFTVRASKDGYDNSHIRLTLGSSSLTQDFSIAKTAPGSGSGVIRFLSSNPAPGGDTELTEDPGGFVYLRNLRMQFEIRHDATLPDAKLQVELFSAAGTRCAYTFVDQAVAANQTMTVRVDQLWNWQMQACGAFPAGTSTVTATLLTLRGPEVNGHLQRTDYAAVTLPLRYTVRRYPAPPASAPRAAPAIDELRWRVSLPVGGDPPIAGDIVDTHCTARESDGAPLTTTITVTWDGLAPLRFTQAFPAGASSSPSGAYYGVSVLAPNNAPAPHARLTCLVTNDRGQTVTASGDIGTPK
jgi:hypothetical protein